ncbi:MAG: tetratricopeptide repeat protein [Gammaproteobacteria bacterium]|nr:MAG: tetratricopeptide repeat protein [Gammaproteobacteria bacterium]
MKRLISVIACCMLAFAGQVHASTEKTPAFVTSKECKSCHEAQYKTWSGSHHHWAWRLPTAETVLGNFNNASFEHQGFTYRFQSKDGQYSIIADGPDGKATRYPVIYTVGITPLQQYLVETDKGRLQALDVAWDTQRKRWYHLYPDLDTSAGNGLHWSGSYKNWNARCAECHATDYRKNYDPYNDSYNSQQSEIGVGCEACHGPGEAHLAWAKEPETFKSDKWHNVNAHGLLETYVKGDASSEINLCAGCHSRREPLGATSPPVGNDFNDYYHLALLRQGLYFPDGQIQDEVYVYGSFLQSRMHANGVSCTNCHDAHSYELKLQGNALCTQCHNPGGNPLFPSLIKANYDTSEHHFHPDGSDGAVCKNCHMPEQYYMVVDGRRDHSFRIPRPDLSAKFNTTDPCVQCHKGKTSAWAEAELKSRFPDGQTGKAHFAELFSRARQSPDATTISALLELAHDKNTAAITRASALHHIGVFPQEESPESIRVLLEDNSPLVRAAAIDANRHGGSPDNLALLYPLLIDPKKSVRLQAARAFLGISDKPIPQKYQQHLGNAMKELQQSLLAKSDFPETQLMLGGIALMQRNLAAATSAFERAVSMDPQLTRAWIMLAKIQAVQGSRTAVQETLSRAMRHNPDHTEIMRAMNEVSNLPAR